MTPQEQARFRILKAVESDPDITQRQLASQLGISLGRVNFFINALVEKGLVKIENFRQSPTKLRYVYALTPRGIGERIRLTKGYLVRKEAEYEALRAEILALKREATGDL